MKRSSTAIVPRNWANSSGDTPAEASVEEDVLATAIAIAKEIEADPDAAEEILARHGLDAEGFEAMMYDIADDPEKSREYNDAVFGSR